MTRATFTATWGETRHAGRWAQLWISACLLAWSGTATAQDIDVQVEKRGDLIVIDVKAPVAASAQQAWAVLTDYEHMASFMSNVKTSSVLRRQGDMLEVSQTGETRVMLFTFSFDAVRSVELLALREIRSHLIKGSFRSYESTTRLVELASGTLIEHHGEYRPTAWLPPVIGPSIIESQTREQYREFIAEIQRRQKVAPERR